MLFPLKHRPAQARMVKPKMSLPLDCGRRLARNVVHNTVDVRHFVDNAVGNHAQYVVRDARPVRCHRVHARYAAKRDRIIVCPLVTHYAHAAHIGQHREILPDFFIQFRFRNFVTEDNRITKPFLLITIGLFVVGKPPHFQKSRWFPCTIYIIPYLFPIWSSFPLKNTSFFQWELLTLQWEII